MTESEIRVALERVPAELRHLFLWLATGKSPAPNAKDGGR
jgi:hypothetical protein